MHITNEPTEGGYKLLSDKIKLRDLVKALHVIDIRTALRWCKKQKILVFKFGKERYINLMDFELAVDRPFIESLKLKYPQNWQDIYFGYKNGDYKLLSSELFQNESFIKPSFVVKGEAANSFINKVKQKFK